MNENLAPLLARMSDDIRLIMQQLQKQREADATRVPPDDLRQAVSDIGHAYVLIGTMADTISVARTAILESIDRLDRIEARLNAVVSPRDVRAGMAAATEHMDATDAHMEAEDAAAPIQAQQLEELVEALQDRVPGTELRGSLEDLRFIAKQLISIMQRQNDETVLLRADMRRFTVLAEQALAQQDGWDGIERRRDSIADRA